MDWTFIVSHSAVTYEELIEKILTGKEFPECEPCAEVATLYRLSSTSHKDMEKIKGGSKTDLVQKEKKFSMIYFSIFWEHKTDCPKCAVKEPVVETAKRIRSNDTCCKKTVFFSNV